MASVKEYDDKIRAKQNELSAKEKELKQQDAFLLGRRRDLKGLEETLDNVRSRLARVDLDFNKEDAVLEKRKLQFEYDQIEESQKKQSLSCDDALAARGKIAEDLVKLKAEIVELKSAREKQAELEDLEAGKLQAEAEAQAQRVKAEALEEEKKALEAEKEAARQRLEESHLEINSILKPIEDALATLKAELAAIDQKAQPEAFKAADVLIQSLEGAFSQYQQALVSAVGASHSKELINDAGKTFKQSCKNAIEIASPKLGIGWGEQLKNFLRAIGNGIKYVASKLGADVNYYEYKQSESLRAVGVFKASTKLNQEESHELENEKGNTPQ
ncbi:substrate of the Dot/Icm secretion system [Legionella quinlivanii]|uniref:Substrate of the Dot/Icm secretion system n=1 Tax=Legionella quinlivanii TaxID=45073 RepID=A0A0W0XZD6_9GAMM|nr:hypothetical protein [Legionella quinlivanii]KTD50151.1 substrate of the Dot/Icm secretion system [Legionella quinlivanii]MCW8450104.1 hypothetical protein [Legionella quinlivanii]SEF49404.1 hypothetical protein SAMN02746093_00361 [Legionella quinlivanii DSM 21216]STY11749.1 Dot/Icm secretion system substrate [Legionella quinlivanii]